ncbi:hypothetical protein NVS47_16830 [Dehalobacterium formicoaceticum]|uniref:Uncharacterized protein n=1 Tax=Dehalobacterium formicoaceticum TaxID=51515 RepID=A0ABT1Y8E3_9FIRM|nr:hypothetical protein [Dehalobacterium formicoaceticum]MCR6547154.1 hypothetical protein [Dehalobacterium formicoaceticum]
MKDPLLTTGCFHKLGCTMSELEWLNSKGRFSIIHPGDVLQVPEKQTGTTI